MRTDEPGDRHAGTTSYLRQDGDEVPVKVHRLVESQQNGLIGPSEEANRGIIPALVTHTRRSVSQRTELARQRGNLFKVGAGGPTAGVGSGDTPDL